MKVVTHEDAVVARGEAGHVGCARVDQRGIRLRVADPKQRGDRSLDDVELPGIEGNHGAPGVGNAGSGLADAHIP